MTIGPEPRMRMDLRSSRRGKGVVSYRLRRPGAKHTSGHPVAPDNANATAYRVGLTVVRQILVRVIGARAPFDKPPRARRRSAASAILSLTNSLCCLAMRRVRWNALGPQTS